MRKERYCKGLWKILLLIVLGINILGYSNNVLAFNVTSEQKSGDKVVLSWKKQSKASKIVVYRFAHSKANAKTKFKKYKTLKGTSKSFTDKKLKKGMFYDYRIDVLGKGNRQIGRTYAYVYMGASTEMNTITHLPIGPRAEKMGVTRSHSDKFVRSYFSTSGFTGFSGYYEIYRKEGEGKSGYNKIADKKLSSGRIDSKKWYKYTDENVEAGQEYWYRVRPYLKVRGKKVYGAWSDVLYCKTVIQNPILAAEVENPVDTKGKIVVRLISDSDNDILTFYRGEEVYNDDWGNPDYDEIYRGLLELVDVVEPDGYGNLYFLNVRFRSGDVYHFSCYLTAYSLDNGTTWKSCDEEKGCRLYPGSEILLRFEVKKSQKEYFRYGVKDDFWIVEECLSIVSKRNSSKALVQYGTDSAGMIDIYMDFAAGDARAYSIFPEEGAY